MIFAGDTSLPYKNAIKFVNFPSYLYNQSWIINLEGSIISRARSEEERKKWRVYNDQEAIQELVKVLNISGFVLANNHILDSASYKETINFLSQINIPHCGVGENIFNSTNPLNDIVDNKNIILLNFGWEVIQCEIADRSKPGVNPLRRGHVLSTFEKIKQTHPNASYIFIFHWNYELEAFPHPRERELAKYLIDNGAAGIIGCHPHRVGGFEIYKNKPIVYSLGNWLFLQQYYHNGKITFPDFCNLEVAFEWNFKTNEFNFHFFEYNKEKSTLTYLRTERTDSKLMEAHTPFRDMNDYEYKAWYKRHRFHKRKGLPIYYWEDSNFIIKIKDIVNKLRDKAVYLAVKTGIK